MTGNAQQNPIDQDSRQASNVEGDVPRQAAGNESDSPSISEPVQAATTEPEKSAANASEANKVAQAERKAHVASNISSSMSGNVVGNMVGNKRMNLLDALHDAEPQVGRRPTPIHDPWPRRKLFIRGIALCLLVVAVVAIIIAILVQTGDYKQALL